MSTQLVQRTLNASTSTLHQKRPAQPRLQWVQVWTVTLVPAPVRFSLAAGWRRWLLVVLNVTCVPRRFSADSLSRQRWPVQRRAVLSVGVGLLRPLLRQTESST